MTLGIQKGVLSYPSIFLTPPSYSSPERLVMGLAETNDSWKKKKKKSSFFGLWKVSSTDVPLPSAEPSLRKRGRIFSPLPCSGGNLRETMVSDSQTLPAALSSCSTHSGSPGVPFGSVAMDQTFPMKTNNLPEDIPPALPNGTTVRNCRRKPSASSQEWLVSKTNL